VYRSSRTFVPSTLSDTSSTLLVDPLLPSVPGLLLVQPLVLLVQPLVQLAHPVWSVL